MNRSAWLWIVALLITLASARWQRVTGPTHELPGDVVVGGAKIHYVLPRTHKGVGGPTVEIRKAPGLVGTVEWKRLGSRDAWTEVPMARNGDALVAELPHEMPGQKLWYRVRLAGAPGTPLGAANASVLLPPLRPAAIRYTGPVPVGVLLPHILLMFLGMLLSARAGLEVLQQAPRFRALTYWTLVALVVGGLVFGPLVIHYAFGGWWTGWPVGSDITDNKTLIAVLAWILAALLVGRARLGRAVVGLAALVTLVIFVIPHSWTAAEPLHTALEVPSARIVPPGDTLARAPTADTSHMIRTDLPRKR